MSQQKWTTSVPLFHLLAFLTIMIWGTTFVSTKVLLLGGLTPSQIMVYRFIIAYLLMLPFAKRYRADNIKEELMLAAAGVCGGSLYFYTENLALNYTMVTNASLILCFTPIVTMILTRIFFRSQHITRVAITGSLIALLGVVGVVFNGSYVLKLDPIGDTLIMISCLSWGFYTVLLKKLESKYETTFITRKVFFYGVITLLPATLSDGEFVDLDIIKEPVVWGNLVFLSIFASLICFTVWVKAVAVLGTTTTSNYIYLSPVGALAASYIVLDERITAVAIIGGSFILFGVLWAQRGEKIMAAIKQYKHSIGLKS